MESKIESIEKEIKSVRSLETQILNVRKGNIVSINLQRFFDEEFRENLEGFMQEEAARMKKELDSKIKVE